ncbi:MAG: DUF1343 domain-containing protein [Rikenellaceae bacterium]|nr:DUF1343 domain-containing protein [Rikenellaceae bacterium]
MKTIFSILLTLLCVAASSAKVVCGAECTDEWQALLKGQRVALLANHTAMVGSEHLLDVMLAKGVDVVAVVSPEHGFRGTADAGEKVASSVDAKSGLPVWSLYSAKSRRLTAEQVAQFDVIVVDMQDVGLRFYTYYITMLSVMQSAAEGGKKVVIFDRPNPNGMYVDGPILDMKYKSGVGALPIPVVHGLTMGEIAKMAVGEGWCRACDVEVVRCKGYTHQTRYSLPVAPSPNLRSMQAIYLYPSVCLFEGTVCSLGRGTDYPFEVYGHPDIKGATFSFTPRSVAGAKYPPLLDKKCYGVDLRQVPHEEIIAKGFNLEYIIDAYKRLGIGEAFFTPFFEKLVGVDYIRKMIIEGHTAKDIRAVWQSDLERYRALRRKYLLYAE